MNKTIILFALISSLTLCASDRVEPAGTEESLAENNLGKRKNKNRKEKSPRAKKSKLKNSGELWDLEMVKDFSSILPDVDLDTGFLAPASVIVVKDAPVVVVKDEETRWQIFQELLSKLPDNPLDSALDTIANELLERFGLTSINSLRSIVQKFAKKGRRINHDDALQKYLRSEPRQRAVKTRLSEISNAPSSPEVAIVRDEVTRVEILKNELAALTEDFDDKALDQIARSVSQRFGLKFGGLCKMLESLKRKDREKYKAIPYGEELRTYVKSEPRQNAVIANIPKQKISEIDRLAMIIEALNALEVPLDQAPDREAELKKIADSLIDKTGLKLNGLRGVLEIIKKKDPDRYAEVKHIDELYRYICRARSKRIK